MVMQGKKLLPGAEGRPNDVHMILAGCGGRLLLSKCPNPRCGGGIVMFLNGLDGAMQTGHMSTSEAMVLLDDLEAAKKLPVIDALGAQAKAENAAFDAGNRDAYDATTLRRLFDRRGGGDHSTIWFGRRVGNSAIGPINVTEIVLFNHYGEQCFAARASFTDLQHASVIAALRVVLFGRDAKA